MGTVQPLGPATLRQSEPVRESVLRLRCSRVTTLGLFDGHLELTSDRLWWVVDEDATSSLATPATSQLIQIPATEYWWHSAIVELWPRRYRLERTALEVCLSDACALHPLS